MATIDTRDGILYIDGVAQPAGTTVAAAPVSPVKQVEEVVAKVEQVAVEAVKVVKPVVVKALEVVTPVVQDMVAHVEMTAVDEALAIYNSLKKDETAALGHINDIKAAMLEKLEATTAAVKADVAKLETAAVQEVKTVVKYVEKEMVPVVKDAVEVETAVLSWSQKHPKLELVIVLSVGFVMGFLTMYFVK